MNLKLLLPTLGMALLLSLAIPAHADDKDVLRILHMLDYIGVDYPEFVQNGEILDQAEYAEQIEFSSEVIKRLIDLPEPRSGDKAGLQAQAARLRQAIDARADGTDIAAISTALSNSLRKSYPVTESPRNAPDVAAAAQLFQDNCSACHGETGAGDGAAGMGMEPAPTDFLDPARQRLRSAFGLYNVISLGVEGTGMPSFAHLPEETRWALAFYVGQMIYSEDQRSTGEALWQTLPEDKRIQNLHHLSTLLPAELEATSGTESGQALVAYLRANPHVVLAGKPRPLEHARQQITASAESYANGDKDKALQQALDAYLEGYELAEAGVSAVDGELNRQIENQMLNYRQLLKVDSSAGEVTAAAELINKELQQAIAKLDDGQLSATGSFIGSFIILAREGLEAILILAAMFAFLNKTGRKDANKYVHAGWVLALFCGIGTWFIATYLIAISGASREITEGISALVAAAVLLSVGLWLHSKSYAAKWQQYVAQRMGEALGNASLLGLTALAFIATYREVFETVLFYQALWQQGDHQAILLGMLAAVAVLAVVSIAIFVMSARLPITQFFAASAALIILLAVVFTGKGVAALQEAGQLPIHSIDFFSLPLLGIYPNVQSLGLQGVVLAIIVIGMSWNHLKQKQSVQT